MIRTPGLPQLGPQVQPGAHVAQQSCGEPAIVGDHEARLHATSAPQERWDPTGELHEVVT